MNPNDSDASRFKSATTDRRGERDLDDLLVHVARGDTEAFEAVYDRLVGPVYGVIRRVLKDPSQSEEVAQEVLLEAWRTAARFDPAVGGAATWVMTIAHRRAIDRLVNPAIRPAGIPVSRMASRSARGLADLTSAARLGNTPGYSTGSRAARPGWVT